MHSIHRPVNVLRSGLEVSLDAPYLGAKSLTVAVQSPLAFRRSSVQKQNSWSHLWMLVLIAIFFWKIKMVKRNSSGITSTILKGRDCWELQVLDGVTLWFTQVRV